MQFWPSAHVGEERYLDDFHYGDCPNFNGSVAVRGYLSDILRNVRLRRPRRAANRGRRNSDRARLCRRFPRRQRNAACIVPFSRFPNGALTRWHAGRCMNGAQWRRPERVTAGPPAISAAWPLFVQLQKSPRARDTAPSSIPESSSAIASRCPGLKRIA